MNEACKAGINYADVRVDKPYKFPCLKQGGKCATAQFPTEEQITEELKSIEDSGLKAIRAIADIKEYVEKTKIKAGQIKCRSGGDLNYVVANLNGHIWANCRSCGLSFNQ
jgi:hypothetical protein